MYILLPLWNHRAHHGCGVEVVGSLCLPLQSSDTVEGLRLKYLRLRAGWELGSSVSRRLRVAYTETLRKAELTEERNLKRMH